MLLLKYKILCGNNISIKKLSRSHIIPHLLANGGKIVIGENLMVNNPVNLETEGDGQIEIGSNVFINYHCIVVSKSKIVIGNNVKIGPNVMIYDHDHDFRNHDSGPAENYLQDDISIEDNCWIGAGAIILRGTHLGKNCVIGAGTICQGIYEDNTLIIGVRENNIQKIR